MVALKNILIILFPIIILSQAQAVEPRVRTNVQVEGERPGKTKVPLTKRQMQAVVPVIKSLAETLDGIASKYPELAEYQKEKVIQESDSRYFPGWVELSHSHNFIAPRVKRAIQPSDFGKDGFYIRFKCMPMPPPQKPAYAMPPPTLTLRNLQLYLWTEVRTGPNASVGLVDEVQSLLQSHVEKLKEIDQKIYRERGLEFKSKDEPAVQVEGTRAGENTGDVDSKRPSWVDAVTKALHGWKMEIIQCDSEPTVRVNGHKGYRLLLRRGRKTYTSVTQVSHPQPEDKFGTKYSHIDLVLFPSGKPFPVDMKEKIPWKDVEQEHFVKPIDLGQGMGFRWFGCTTIFWQEDLRKSLDLKGGDDRIQLLIDGIYVQSKDRVASGQVQLPWRLQYFGDKAIPYIDAAIKKYSDNYRGHGAVSFALGYIPSERSTEILRSLYALEKTRRPAAKALLRQPYRKSAKKEYLDMLRRQIPVLRDAAEACVEFKWKEAIPLLQKILTNPHSWTLFPTALKAKRQLEGQPEPKEINEAVQLIIESVSIPTPAGQEVIEQAKKIILDSADKEAAAVTAVYLALWSSKGSTPQTIQVNEIGRDIFQKLPAKTTGKLLKSLVQSFKDERKYDNRRFKKLLESAGKHESQSKDKPDVRVEGEDR